MAWTSLSFESVHIAIGITSREARFPNPLMPLNVVMQWVRANDMCLIWLVLVSTFSISLCLNLWIDTIVTSYVTWLCTYCFVCCCMHAIDSLKMLPLFTVMELIASFKLFLQQLKYIHPYLGYRYILLDSIFRNLISLWLGKQTVLLKQLAQRNENF